MNRQAGSEPVEVEVVVQTHGKVRGVDRAYVHDKVLRACDRAPGKVRFARVDLTEHGDPARERPATANAELDVDGHVLRARAAAPTMHEAVDLLESRLRARVVRLAEHQKSKHLRLRGGGDHEWRHGDPTGDRPPYFPRPVSDRQVLRRKTFAVEPMTPDEAAFDLECLGHDFFLFTNRETGEENVVIRKGEGSYELLEPSATCSLVETAAPVSRSPVRPPTATTWDAVGMLDVGDLPFVFYVDADDGRGKVLYRRYDGNYGLIGPGA